MATMDEGRIVRNTSARKSVKRPNTHSSLEVAAIKASHEAYVTTLVQGYEAQMEELEAAYATELTAFEAKQWTEIHTVPNSQQTSIRQAVEAAQEEAVKEIAALKKEVSAVLGSLTGEKAEMSRQLEIFKASKNEASSTHDAELRTIIVAVKAANKKSQTLVEDMARLKTLYRAEMVRAQAPGIYDIKLIFDDVTRTDHGTPTTEFRVLAEKLAGDIKVPLSELIFYKRRGGGKISDFSMTLFELELKNGAVVMCTKSPTSLASSQQECAGALK